MFCPNCGKQIPDQSVFCPSCGTRVQAAAPQQPGAPQASMPQQPDAPQPPAPTGMQPTPYQQPVPYVAQPALPMKWYKFVIWVQLFLSALVSAGSAFLLLTGAQYGGDSDLAYSMIGGLRVVDIIFALAQIGIAVFAIYVRQQLAGFKKGAPELYLRFIIIANVVSISYNLIVVWLAVSTLTRFLPGANFFDALGMLLESSSTQASLFQLIVSVIAVIVMYFLNRTYFNKRAHLFVNA